MAFVVVWSPHYPRGPPVISHLLDLNINHLIKETCFECQKEEKEWQNFICPPLWVKSLGNVDLIPVGEVSDSQIW